MAKEPSELSIQKAAQAWQGEKTSNKVMDEELAFEFARILDEIWSKPWLGNATTRELLDELQVRATIGGYSNYKTVDGK